MLSCSSLGPTRRERATGSTWDVEVEDAGAALARVEAIGGALVGRVENEFGVHICADPDGNEFCLTPQ